MKRSIAASERQFAEAAVFAFPGRCYAGAHAIGSPALCVGGLSKAADRFDIPSVDAPAVFAIRSTDLAMASLVTKSQRPIAGTRNRRGLVERPGTRPR